MSSPRGALAALTTPFGSDGEVDVDALQRHVAWLSAAGLDGVMPCGTTGEGPLLTDDEAVAVVGRVAEAAGGMSVLAQVGRISTAATLRLGERALAAGAHALAVVTPFYYRLQRDQVARHLAAVVGGFPGVPVLAYTIPRCTGNEIEPHDLRALVSDGLAGIKDSTKSVAIHRAYVHSVRAAGAADGAVLSGSDALLTESRRAGGHGSVTAWANVRPELIVSLHRVASAGRWDAARDAQAQLDADRAAQSGRSTPETAKQALSRRLAEHGIEYPERVRGPL